MMKDSSQDDVTAAAEVAEETTATPADATADEAAQVDTSVPTETSSTMTQEDDLVVGEVVAEAEVEAAEAPVDAQPPVTIEGLTQQEESALRDLRMAELQVKARHNRYQEAGLRVDQARANRDSVVRARDSLGAWLDERRRSLSIQLLTHVDGEIARIESDEQRIREFDRGHSRNFEQEARRLRRAFVRRMLVAAIFSIAVTLILLAIALILRQFKLTMPVLELSAWRYVALFAILFATGAFGSLFNYFRGFNQMKYQLNVALAWGRNALASIDRIRADHARLTELRPQLAERLEFYGAVLQEPWVVPDSQDRQGDLRPIADGLPANLRIAEVKADGEESWNRLLQRFTAERFTIGLRRESSTRLLAEAARRHGFTVESERIDFDFLDRDNMQRDLRNVLMSFARNPEVLEGLGRAQVAQIASEIQKGLSPLNDHRPDVSVANPNALDGLQLGQDLLADWRQAQASWDGFISEILEDPSALSVLAFSESGEADGEHHRFSSIASGPARVKPQASVHVEWAEIQSESITGTEVVTRIDITDPIDVSKVALFRHLGDDDGAPSETQTSGL